MEKLEAKRCSGWEELVAAMDVLNLCVVILVAIATVLLAAFSASHGSSKAAKRKQQKLPPGPWSLPLIGSLHHVVSTLPHRTLAELSRRHGPVMFLRLGESPTVVVSSAEAAALVMKTHDLVFADRPLTVTMDIYSSGGSSISSAPYGERWRQLRKACVLAMLAGKQVKRHEGIRAEEVGKILSSVATSARDGAVVNLSRQFTALSNNISSRAMFSGRCSQHQQDAFILAVEKVVSLLGGFSLVDLFPSSRLVRWFSNDEREMKKSIGSIQRIISEMIREAEAARAAAAAAARDGPTTDDHNDDDEDMLEALLRIQEEDTLAFPVTSEIIGAVLLDLFVAGTHSSSTVLGWVMSELANSPKTMAKVQSEVRQVLGRDKGVITITDLSQLPFMKMVIKEALRKHPPVPLLVVRKTREDCNIMGYDIPKGTNVNINVFSISRDPRYWECPEEFKPERFENNNIDYYGTHFEFTPFGAGRRQCPGIQFGTSTVEIGLANLLYHFDWVHPSGTGAASLDMSEKHGISVRRRFDLELLATPYVQSTTA